MLRDALRAVQENLFHPPARGAEGFRRAGSLTGQRDLVRQPAERRHGRLGADESPGDCQQLIAGRRGPLAEPRLDGTNGAEGERGGAGFCVAGDGVELAAKLSVHVAMLA